MFCPCMSSDHFTKDKYLNSEGLITYNFISNVGQQNDFLPKKMNSTFTKLEHVCKGSTAVTITIEDRILF